MSFYEEWHVQQAAVLAERQRQIQEAQQVWPGCRVWCRGIWGVVYGEVEGIDDDGRVRVLYAYDSDDRPLYIWMTVQSLGKTVTRANE